jgi:methylated-DNA-[protein]-cysteine S-methyltransferase
MKRIVHQIHSSPVGELFLAETGGAPVAVLFLDSPEEVDRCVSYLARSYPGAKIEPGECLRLVRLLDWYFEGADARIAPPDHLAGTEFEKRVWAEIARIPLGRTISYGEIARRLGNPRSSRAVGLATGRNPISILVPCHRVVGATGELIGYGGGLQRKRWLLEHESPTLFSSTTRRIEEEQT